MEYSFGNRATQLGLRIIFINTMRISLGFSPCPNDTFMFDAMLHQKVDTEGISFRPVIKDVEVLNKKAIRHELEMTKLSFNAFVYACSNYVLLQSGAALGNNCGPLLICEQSKRPFSSDFRVAIPGKFTTANSLFQFAFPDHPHTSEYLFSEIENAILDKRVDAGVIIHENRFTYQQKGLVKILDLGQFWESQTSLPIPLGGIAVSRTLNVDVQQKLQRIMRRSIDYAFKNPSSSMEFVSKYAQEMEYDVMKKHIQLYVNDYSLDLGDKGRNAVHLFFDKAGKSSEHLFVEL